MYVVYVIKEEEAKQQGTQKLKAPVWYKVSVVHFSWDMSNSDIVSGMG